jgi:hypothetical protein
MDGHPVEARSRTTRVAAWLAAAAGIAVAATVLVRTGAVRRLLGAAAERAQAATPGSVAPPAGAAAAPAPAAAGGRPQGAAPAPAPLQGPVSRDEPLYAGRQPAWWNDRLRAIERLPGPDLQRLRALTLRRAAGVGLRPPAGDAGTPPVVAPAPAGEGR